MSMLLHHRLLFALLTFSILLLVRSGFAAQSAEYKPPKASVYSMEAHFAWCGEARTPAERLQRYEKFWELQHPKEEDGYDDDRHIRMVRHCAYRLAQLYAETGRSKDCVRMLKWLEKEDDRFEVERSQEE